MAPIACLLCALDPQTTSLAVPLAQATLIAAPILLRKEIASGVRRLRGRGEESAPDDDLEPDAADATEDPDQH